MFSLSLIYANAGPPELCTSQHGRKDSRSINMVMSLASSVLFPPRNCPTIILLIILISHKTKVILSISLALYLLFVVVVVVDIFCV